MFNKISFIIKYKKSLYLLSFLFLIVAIFDLIGVTLLLKLLNIIMNFDVQNQIISFFKEFLSITEKESIIIIFSLFLILFSIIKNIYKYITFKFQFNVVQKLHTDISTSISKSYLKSNFKEFSKYNPQELIKSSVDSVNVFITFIVIGGLNLLSNLLIATMLLGFLFYKNFIMTFSILILIISINYLFILVTKTSSSILQKERENIIACMYDSIANIIYNKLEIFSYKKEDFFNKKYASHVKEFNQNRYKFNILNSLPQLYSDFILYFSVSSIVIILFVFSGDNNESLDLLLLYALVMIRIVPVSSAIISSINNIKYYSDSINIIFNILNMKKNNEYRLIDNTKNSIDVNDLTISYDNTNILENINIKIEKNTKIALIGSSGSGKSTLVKSIAGVLKPKKGTVGIFNSSISYVTQDPYFFDGTILDNILFGETLLLDENKLNDILRKCLLMEFISTLSDGIHTNIGHRASLLSGGQKQRLALARALYFDSEIIILDEVTSALDNNSEYEIRQVIDNMKDTTIIMIAHRLSSIRHFDNIILLGNKSILVQGKYSELLSSSTDFKILINKGTIDE